MRFNVLTYNNIAQVGLARFPEERYLVSSEGQSPDALMLRSHRLSADDIQDSVIAVGRAGAGVNNIPVDALSKRGVPVFNAPGANANAVKELVLAAMMLASRNICEAYEYVRSLESSGEALDKEVEAGKKRFVGFELPKRTLGVIGLGSIGVAVANAAHHLGMRVVGFDPKLTVKNAWQLSSDIERATHLETVFIQSDFVTVHVPLLDETKGLLNKSRLVLMPRGATVLNFARGEISADADILELLDSGHLHAYVTDFPSSELIAHRKAIALPHLGASTVEAEENCAVMVADNLRDYLENGNITYSVNFPDVSLPRPSSGCRIAVANANVPNMVGQISTLLAESGLNIADLLNKSRGELAYTVVDLDDMATAETLDSLKRIPGVLNARLLC